MDKSGIFSIFTKFTFNSLSIYNLFKTIISQTTDSILDTLASFKTKQ